MTTTAVASIPDAVLSRWSALAGRPAKLHGTGLINQTFLVDGLPPGQPRQHEGVPERAIVQRLHRIFHGHVNEDIEVVTTHLASKGLLTPRILRTDDGALWVDAEDGAWRALSFIDGHSVDRIGRAEKAGPTLVGAKRSAWGVGSLAMAKEAARLVGRFHAALHDLDYAYGFSRGNVHDTTRHLDNLRAALAAHPDHRLHADVASIAETLFAAASALPDLSTLPLRNSHGDLKISNILFDAQGEALCLVDLDTLSRMAWAFEMGDALRSWCNAAGEDVADGALDPTIFEAAVRGYASTARVLWTPEEVRSLVPGLQTICLELSSRFLADALNESYFGFDKSRFERRGEHNLLRGRGQWSLFCSVRAQAPALERVIHESFTG